MILGFGVLISRLFVLQIVRGDYYRQLAEGNRIKIKNIPALRGVVYDRTGELLVRNTPEGREYVYGSVFAHLLGYIGEISKEELSSCEESSNAILISPSESDSRENSSALEEVSGARIEKAHKIGQTSPQDCIYVAGDLIGKMGIEKEYDLLLRGGDGGILEEFDAQGEKIRDLGRKEPIAGESLQLTVDLELQKKVFEAMEDKKGAVVASLADTGEILALVSTPSFDPNVFSKERQVSSVKRQEELQKILNDESQPMFNRAISGVYPPASTFKIVTALAGLQEKEIDKDTIIEDSGQIKIGDWVFGNWYYRQYGGTEGVVDIVKAIKRSNDIFFYRVGERLGIERLGSWAGKLGFGEVVGIDLPGEAKGLVPSEDWKREVKGESWFLGDDFITAIGQGDLLATPLQVNMMTTVIANQGKLCLPKLLKAIKNGQQDTYYDQRPHDLVSTSSCRSLEISEENLVLVREGMRQACLRGQKEGEKNGTGFPFFDFGTGGPATTSADFKRIEVGCKTGTAESPGEKSEPHAWFTVFAPIENPEIVLTVLVENGGEGSEVASPIAKEILKWWFENRPSSS